MEEYTSNAAVNALLCYYLDQAKSNGTEITADIRLPDELPLPEIDFCTILGNLLIFLVVFLDSRLHTPMYLFVSILSLLELGYTAATIPKMLSNLLSEKKTISFSGCLLQIYFFHSLGATECYLLTAMAYDRYLAICQPLHYPTRMTPALCVKIAVGCWLGGLAGPVAEISLVSHLPFCGPNHIQHIFCDFPPVLSLACTDTSINVLVDFVISSCKILATFLLILSSYFILPIPFPLQ